MTGPARDQNENDDLGVTDEEAEQLLADAVEADERDTGRSTELGGERSSDQSTDRDDDKLQGEIQKWKSLARKHEGEAKKLGGRLKEYEDANKSDLERLQERAGTAESRADKAESMAKALQIAMDRAPEHATLAQVRAVAKRVRGDGDDAIEQDADELFELLVPVPDSEPKPGTKTPARPKERLKGGTAAPDEEPEETDPRKLAALLPRRR
jgi:hypothetical protein